MRLNAGRRISVAANDPVRPVALSSVPRRDIRELGRMGYRVLHTSWGGNCDVPHTRAAVGYRMSLNSQVGCDQPWRTRGTFF